MRGSVQTIGRSRRWVMTLDISADRKQYDNEEISVEAFAKKVAAKIRELKPYKMENEDWGYHELEYVEQKFEWEVDDVDSFDDALSDLYDWGDVYRCWIAVDDFTHECANQ